MFNTSNQPPQTPPPTCLARDPRTYTHPPKQILRRETVRYDDQRGPVVLVVILLAVFTLAYVLAMVWTF